MEQHFVLRRAASTTETSDRESARRRVRHRLSSDEEEVEGGSHRELRSEAFGIVWSKIEGTIKAVLKDINSDACNEIHSWVLESFGAVRSMEWPSCSEAATRPFPVATDPASKRLHTGLVITRNMEFVDDLMTFEDLAGHLRSRGCYVANLSSLEFSADSGTACCIRSLLRQFLSSTVDAADISVLSSWYRDQSNRDAPVVVIVNDLERCSGSVLSDFIIMLSEWIVKIPVILIMGVATTVNVPGDMLRFDALQCLSCYKFILQSPVERLNAVVEAVLVKDCSGFSVGHKVAAFLNNYFTGQDGTLSSFVRTLKIACTQHFITEPLSCMLKGFDEEEIQIQCFQDEKYAFLREAVSKYDCKAAPAPSRSKTDEQVGQKLVNALTELKRLRNLWSTALLCLYEAGKCSQIQLLDLLCEALDPDLHSSTSRKGKFITQAIENVRELPEAPFIMLLKGWEKHARTIPEIHKKVKDLQYMLKFDKHKRRKLEPPDTTKTQKTQSHLNVQRAVNERAVSFIESLIKDFMQPMDRVPFHEITCFNNVEKLKAALAGDPRRQIQVDLLGFHKILQCSCCSRDSAIVLPSMQDTSIMYSLSQEHGNVINLHDWYQSFKLVLQPAKKGKQKTRPSSKKMRNTDKGEKPSDAAIQARFCKAVTELQITGLLRMQSKRRPDYLQRVAFGL